MRKRGFTLVELVVAMGLFVIIITLVVSAFISVSNLRALTKTMKEVQQRTRIATEMITRLARQADKVVTGPTAGAKQIELYFNLYNDNPNYGYRFLINESGQLLLSECKITNEDSTLCDSSWVEEKSLLGDGVKVSTSDSFFSLGGTIPPTLEVKIKGIITSINNNPYYSNDLTINTAITLEGVK